ncbi:hypothetical protein [Paenibacillus sp. IHB B 3415]|uniref:hypothetical protein n=1 Tax=Paenibacillus sp. IHB B 3415 TaxID=867080 RepID=UPI001F418273|nr:hypothetical protein [Paenibacillus sp. IHB B 3415]
MTRNRAEEDGTPGELSSLYYAQRASMGLLITEGVQPAACRILTIHPIIVSPLRRHCGCVFKRSSRRDTR